MLGTQAGGGSSAQRARSRSDRRSGDAGFAGIQLGVARRFLVAALQSFRFYVLWSTSAALRPRTRDSGGSALHIFMTGSIGAAFGLACGGIQHRRRLVLFGTLAGLTWHGLANAVLWQRINPLVPIYSAQPATIFSHALFGACLGYLGRKFPADRSVTSPWNGVE